MRFKNILQRIGSLVLIMTFFCISISAKSKLEVDSFFLNNSKFLVQTPKNWLVLSTENEVRQDTSWNYIAQLGPYYSNTNAQLGVQIVDNSADIPPNKRRRKVKYEVVDKKINQVTGYEVMFDLVPVKGCRACGFSYTNLFTAPLTDDKTINIIFTGYGNEKTMDSLLLVFNEFCEHFFTENQTTINQFLFPTELENHLSYTTLNVFNGTSVRIEFDSTWAVLFDSISGIFSMQKADAFPKKVTTVFQFEKESVSMKPLEFPTNSKKKKPALPVPEFEPVVKKETLDPGQSEYVALVDVTSSFWFQPNRKSSDPYWEEIVVSSRREIYRPNLRGYSVTIRLYAYITDPLLKQYYMRVVDDLMDKFLRQNMLLRDQYIDSSGLSKMSIGRVNKDAKFIETGYTFFGSNYLIDQSHPPVPNTPADKPKRPSKVE